ncbi:glycosyl hydrolase family 65, N-terminal domain-containing protein [Aspergillus pseudoustus]|uniref:Glycosyl hydrolase family 65, N-terminal domain-containing protein n=1 Tax=Aspergillus pseudoustus TaxID=1810923 RepID=A0ABR4I876_9EURO
MKYHQNSSLFAILVASLPTPATTAAAAAGALDPSRYLWYAEPAPPTDWENGALPIGNGRLAGTIYGGAPNEVITVNENTIWSGPLQDRTPEHALEALPVARDLLLAGNITEAGDFIKREMMHPIDSMRAYSYFGNFEVDFGHGDGKLDGFRRWLDTRKGDAGVEYVVDGVKYTREYVASFPAGVLAARFTASRKGALDLNATFSRAESVTGLQASVAGSTPWLRMSGSSGQPASEDPIIFTGQATFQAKGARVAASDGTLIITGATTVDVFLDVETSYRYPTQQQIDSEIQRKLKRAVKKGYDRIKQEALKDSSSLLERASINLGQSSNETRTLPTDQRILRARSGIEDDPELVTLTWNYGRHMLVAGYLPDETAVRKRLAERGRRYWDLGSNVSYRQFEGKHGSVRIVIDQQMRPLEQSPQDQADQFQKAPAANIKPQVLMTCPPDIAVYLLSELRWSTVDIDKIQDLVIDEHRKLDQVVIEGSYKHILLSLVPGQNATNKPHIDSGLMTNGKTVLLHGAPGSGKTFSVECLAETAEKPLLRLTHGKLGGSIQEMSKSLEESFQLSDRWGCIMLLDDVDVFLSKRSNDLTQNIMGTLFMQLSETHNGLLFLTTNRVGVFDEAFLSRISLKLHFTVFTRKQIMAVLKLSLARIEERLRSFGVRYDIKRMEIHDCVLNMFARDSAHGNIKPNGRGIVNLCETALILAQREAKENPPDEEDVMGSSVDLRLQGTHFLYSIKLSSGFEEYLNEVKRPAEGDEDNWRIPRAKAWQSKPGGYGPRRRAPNQDAGHEFPYRPSTAEEEDEFLFDQGYYPEQQEEW